ncbi:hypothetical protein ACFQH6_15625 [Halobacteriaceae archaeon GCM10025711]
MADRPDPLLVWALATFHVAALVSVAAVALHANGVLGQVLGELDTLVGVGLFVVVWALTWWSNRRWLTDVSLADDGQGAVVAGARWGGVEGVLVLVAPLLVLVVVLVAQGGSVPVLAGLGVVALLVAGVVGGVVGAAFALVDVTLVRTAEYVLPEPMGEDP